MSLPDRLTPIIESDTEREAIVQGVRAELTKEYGDAWVSYDHVTHTLHASAGPRSGYVSGMTVADWRGETIPETVAGWVEELSLCWPAGWAFKS